MEKIFEYNKSPYDIGMCRCGRGLFANRVINQGELIGIAPFFEIPIAEEKILKDLTIGNYYFVTLEEPYRIMLVLGAESLINHSYKSNIRYRFDFDKQMAYFYAQKNISLGEELRIDYSQMLGDWEWGDIDRECCGCELNI